MKAWTYVITVDQGGAPNFDPPETTLAVCKPRIRRRAQPGDLVLAFNGVALNSADPHSVRWAGVVSEVIPLKDYWNDPRFEGKKPGRSLAPDNIYRPSVSGDLEQVPNVTHMCAEESRDLSGVNALVLEPSWYFGPTVAILPDHFSLRMIGGRRGERCVGIDNATRRKLEQWLDDSVPNGIAPKPSIDRHARSGTRSSSRCTRVRRKCG